MPPLGFVTGGVDFSNNFLVLKAAPSGATFAAPAAAARTDAITWNYGNFISILINFFIVALCIFIVVRGLNKMKRPNVEKAPVSKDCMYCQMMIPINAARCPHCTSEMAGAERI